MNLLKLTATLLFALIFISRPAFADKGINSDGTLNAEQIQQLYLDGNFQVLENTLETFRKKNPEMSEKDKFIVYKYLSIVYAANPDTKDKAESYMFQVLKLRPTIEVLDMYISESIKAIFNNVRKDYQEKMKYLESEENEFSEQEPKPDLEEKVEPEKAVSEPQKTPSKKNRKWMWWTGSGIIVTAAVATFLLSSEPDDEVVETSRGSVTLD